MNSNITWGHLGTTGKFRFHKTCGSNIECNKARTIATRITGFADAICFSECPILPDQLFPIAISSTEKGWSGHVRLGVTQVDPNAMTSLPEMIIPDMTEENRTWAVAVTKFHNKIQGRTKDLCDVTKTLRFHNLYVDADKLLYAGRRRLNYGSDGLRFPNVGQSVLCQSRLGVLLKPSLKNKCELHLVINGEDMGPSLSNIPLDRPLYVIIDVYSVTREVSIVPVSRLSTLQDICRDVIKETMDDGDVGKLDLPTSLIEYLQCRGKS